VACGYTEKCKCCCTNGCCPGVCWFKGLILTMIDRFGNCTTAYNLTWDAACINDCCLQGEIGCWKALNVQLGTCQFDFKVSCCTDQGVCVLVLEATNIAFPNDHGCFPVDVQSCNPLVGQGTTGRTFPIGPVCGCPAQPPQGLFTLTSA
jgi:hypothetical protein